MPLGSRHRLIGRLTAAYRGLILEIEGGGVWVLDADPSARDLLGRRVIVEGVRTGFDRLEAEWIGLAPADMASAAPLAGRNSR